MQACVLLLCRCRVQIAAETLNPSLGVCNCNCLCSINSKHDTLEKSRLIQRGRDKAGGLSSDTRPDLSMRDGSWVSSPYPVWSGPYANLACGIPRYLIYPTKSFILEVTRA